MLTQKARSEATKEEEIEPIRATMSVLSIAAMNKPDKTAIREGMTMRFGNALLIASAAASTCSALSIASSVVWIALAEPELDGTSLWTSPFALSLASKGVLSPGSVIICVEQSAACRDDDQVRKGEHDRIHLSSRCAMVGFHPPVVGAYMRYAYF